MADRAALEAEKEKLVAEMAAMQKQLMEDEFEPRKYFASDEMKAFKEKYHEKAVRVSDIANQLLRLQ